MEKELIVHHYHHHPRRARKNKQSTGFWKSVGKEVVDAIDETIYAGLNIIPYGDSKLKSNAQLMREQKQRKGR